jgi:hypothetical protein
MEREAFLLHGHRLEQNGSSVPLPICSERTQMCSRASRLVVGRKRHIDNDEVMIVVGSCAHTQPTMPLHLLLLLLLILPATAFPTATKTESEQSKTGGGDEK